MKEMDALEIDKIYRKIPRWFRNPTQINSQILIKYLELAKKGKPVKIDELSEKCKHIQTFQSNLAQMCYSSDKNNAKIFRKDGQYLYLERVIQDYVLNLYKNFERRYE